MFFYEFKDIRNYLDGTGIELPEKLAVGMVGIYETSKGNTTIFEEIENKCRTFFKTTDLNQLLTKLISSYEKRKVNRAQQMFADKIGKLKLKANNVQSDLLKRTEKEKNDTKDKLIDRESYYLTFKRETNSINEIVDSTIDYLEKYDSYSSKMYFLLVFENDVLGSTEYEGYYLLLKKYLEDNRSISSFKDLFKDETSYNDIIDKLLEKHIINTTNQDNIFQINRIDDERETLSEKTFLINLFVFFEKQDVLKKNISNEDLRKAIKTTFNLLVSAQYIGKIISNKNHDNKYYSYLIDLFI